MNEAAAPSIATRSLGDIAASLPGATAVFRKRKLDFCCGGAESLENAARRKNLDLASIETELASLAPQPAQAPESVADMIAHILERYHETHRRELPELVRLATRVDRVHADHPAVPKGLVELLEQIRGELESHMRKEEQILFPLMLAGGAPMIGHPIAVMRSEHVSHGEQLERLAALTGDFTPPAEACNTWRALYAGLAKLVDDLIEHIHTENNILFPKFAA